MPAPSDPVAFVAGATGFTGKAVVRALVARGARTLAHVRPDSGRLADHRASLAAAGAEVDTTPWEEDAMRGALARLRPTHVFALLGTTKARGRRGSDSAVADTYEAVDYGLSVMLLRAAQAAGSSPRFIYLSSEGVKAGTRNRYLQARWRVEEALASSGLPFVIARPSFIVGDRDEPRALEHVGAGAIDGLLAVVGALGARRLRDRYRSTSDRALADALVRLALDPAAESRVYRSEELR